eukprot:560139-Pelagomonas_calceolata.AAC.6
MVAMARSAMPMRRMQWCKRPGPNRPCAISNPRPSPCQANSSASAGFVCPLEMNVSITKGKGTSAQFFGFNAEEPLGDPLLTINEGK